MTAVVEITDGYRPEIRRAEVVIRWARYADRRSRRWRKCAVAISDEDVQADVRCDGEVRLAVFVEIGGGPAQRKRKLPRRIGCIGESGRGFRLGDLQVGHVGRATAWPGICHRYSRGSSIRNVRCWN